MADNRTGTTLFGAAFGQGTVPPQERETFRRYWLTRRGGTYKFFFGDTPSYRMDDPIYQEWVSSGRPAAYAPPSKTRTTGAPHVTGKPGEPRQYVTGTPSQTGTFGETGTAGGEDDLVKRLAQLEIEKFEWQKRQQEIENMMRQNQATAESVQQQRELSYLRNLQRESAMGGANQIQWAERQATEFEDWRNRLLGQMTGPANSVARWFVTHKPNPYIPTRRQQAERQLEQAQGELAAIPGREQLQMGQQGLEQAQGSDRARLMEDVASLQREIESGSVDDEMALFQRGPEAPAFLRELAPAVGKYLSQTPLNLPTPSGQQLNRLAPSQSQYVAGAIDWLGGRSWEDILSAAGSMQPRTPRGAGGTRWRPPSQGRV